MLTRLIDALPEGMFEVLFLLLTVVVILVGFYVAAQRDKQNHRNRRN